MDMLLSEEQKLITSTAKNFFEKKYPREVMRETIEGNGYSQDMWEQIINLGWLGMPLPEEYGGLKMGVLDSVLLSEEMGKVAFQNPYFINYLACQILLEAGSERQKKEFLSKVVNGDLILTVAYAEHSPKYDPFYITTKATEEDAGYQLNGVKQFVEYADIADYVLCVARTEEDVYSEDGISLFLLDLKTDGIVTKRLQTLARDKQYEVTMKDVFVSKDQLIGEKGRGGKYIQSVFSQARLIKYAELLGRLEKVLEMATEYSKERVQNGRPIGSYQSLQHRFANAATEIDGAKFLMYRTATSNDGCGKVPEEAILKVCAWIEKIYVPISWKLHETFGAIGVTDEYELHYYTRCAKAHHPLFGDEDYYIETLKKELW